MTPAARLLCEFLALIAATKDHLDHLPPRVRALPHTRTLADQIDHAQQVATEATPDDHPDMVEQAQ